MSLHITIHLLNIINQSITITTCNFNAKINVYSIFSLFYTYIYKRRTIIVEKINI